MSAGVLRRYQVVWVHMGDDVFGIVGVLPLCNPLEVWF